MPDSIARSWRAALLIAVGFMIMGLDSPSRQQVNTERLLEQLIRDQESVVKAIEGTRELIQQSMHRPYLPDLYLRLAELHIEKSRILYHLKRVQDPEASKAVIVMEANLLKTKAIDLYDKILKDFPDYPYQDKVLFFMAHEYRELGRFDRMLSCYSTITNRFPKSPYLLESYLLIGDYHFDAMDINKAEKAYRTILEAPESHVHGMARYKMAWCHINRNQYPEALALLEMLVKDSRYENQQTEIDAYKRINLRREAFMDLAYCYTEVKAPEEALEYFSVLSDSKNLYLAVLDKLAQRYYLKEEWAAAAGVYRNILSLSRNPEKNTEYAERLFACAQKAKDMNKPEENVKMLVNTLEALESSWRIPDKEKEEQRKKLELYARDLATRMHLDAKEKKDRTFFSRAADAYAYYLGFFDEETLSGDILFNQAEAFYEAQRYYEAAEAYEMLARKETSSTEARASANTKRQNLYGAVVSYHKSLKEEKGVDDLRKMEAREGLRQTGNQYLELYPKAEEAAEVAFNVAWVSYEQGDYGDAHERFKAFVKAYPRSQEALAAAHLAMDIQKNLDNLQGLLVDAREFLANPQITDVDFRKNVEGILLASEHRQVEELTVMVKDGVEGSEAGLLALGGEARDAGMRETALYNLFVVNKEGEQIPKILGVGKKILAGFPESKHREDVVATMAHYYLKAADFQNAASYSAKVAAMTAKGQQAEHWLRVARLRGWMGETAASIRYYRKALALLPSDKKPEAVEELLEKMEASKNWSGVISQCQKLMGWQPDDPQWAFRQGVALQELGRRQEAMKMFKKVETLFTQKASSKSEEITAETRACAAQARFHRAEQEMRTFGRISFRGGKIDNTLVQKKMAGLQSVEAAVVEVAQYASPRWTIASLDLAARANDVLSRFFLEAPVPKGLTKEQKAQYQQLLKDKVRPFDEKAQQYRRAALNKAFQLGVFCPEVHACFAAVNDGGQPPSILRGRPPQDQKEAAGQPSAESLQISLYADPGNISLLRSLAGVYLQEGKSDLAALVLQRCLDEDPEDVLSHNLVGLVRLQQGRDQEAYHSFQRALEINPGFVEAKANLVVLCEGYGNRLGASQWMETLQVNEVPVVLDVACVHPGFSAASARLQ